MHTHITHYRLLAGVLLLLLWPAVSPAQRAVSAGQRAASPGQPAFAAKDYAAFLAHLPGEAAAVAARPAAAFDRLVMLAIALDRTAAWEGEAGRQATALLRDAPDALRYLRDTRILLREDTEGLLGLLTGGPAPTPRIVATCVPLMRDHGYELAAHCLGTIADDLPGKRVIAWARIPPEKQPPVDARGESGPIPPSPSAIPPPGGGIPRAY